MNKTNFFNLGISFFLILFISASCGQRSGGDVQEELAEMREEKSEIVQQINEALNIADVSEFRNKTRDALDNLDDLFTNYQDEMESADREINEEAREAIISMKEKKTAIEFNLDLLENRDGARTETGLTEDRGTGDPTGTGFDYDGAERTDDVPRTDTVVVRPTTERGDRAETDRPAGVQQPEERAAERPGQMTGPDRTGDMTGGPDRAYVDSGETLSQQDQQIMEETRNDLVTLRNEVEQFMEGGTIR